MVRGRRPEPELIDGRYAYTLTSYEPVSISVSVAHVSDEEVDRGIRDMLSYYGGSEETLTDAWLAENVGEVTTVAGLRPYVRRQLESMYAEAAERSKPDLCVRALAGRLCQEVPAEELARARAVVRTAMERDLSENGLDVAGFLTLSGMTDTAFEAMVDSEALAAAEREAALDAFVGERGISVDETEYPGLLGLSPADARQLMQDMRSAGHAEYVRRAALHAKAVRLLVEECSCSYEHETPTMARLREAEYQAAYERVNAHRNEGGPKLKLV